MIMSLVSVVSVSLFKRIPFEMCVYEKPCHSLLFSFLFISMPLRERQKNSQRLNVMKNDNV